MSRSVFRFASLLVLSLSVDAGATKSEEELGRWRNSSCQDTQCATPLTIGHSRTIRATRQVVRPWSMTGRFRGKRQYSYSARPFVFMHQHHIPAFRTGPPHHVIHDHDLFSLNPTHSDEFLTENPDYYNSGPGISLPSSNCNGELSSVSPHLETGYPYESKLSSLDEIPNVIKPPHHAQLSHYSEIPHQNQDSNNDEYKYSSHPSFPPFINFEEGHMSVAPPHLPPQPFSPPELYKSPQITHNHHTSFNKYHTNNMKGYTYGPSPPAPPVVITGPQPPIPPTDSEMPPPLEGQYGLQHYTATKHKDYPDSNFPSFPTDINVQYSTAFSPKYHGIDTSYVHKNNDQNFELKHSDINDEKFISSDGPESPSGRNRLQLASFPNDINFRFTETKLSHVDTKGHYYGLRKPSPPTTEITLGPEPPAPPPGGPQPPSPPPGYYTMDSFPHQSSNDFPNKGIIFSRGHKEGYNYGPRPPYPSIDIIGGPQPPAPPRGGPQPPGPRPVEPPREHHLPYSAPFISSIAFRNKGSKFLHNHKQGYSYGPHPPSPSIGIIEGPLPPGFPSDRSESSPGGLKPPVTSTGQHTADSSQFLSSSDFYNQEKTFSSNHNEGYIYGSPPPINNKEGPKPPAPPPVGPQQLDITPENYKPDSFAFQSSTDFQSNGATFPHNHKEGYQYGPRPPSPPTDITGGPQPPAPPPGGPQPPAPPQGPPTNNNFHNGLREFSQNYYGLHPADIAGSSESLTSTQIKQKPSSQIVQPSSSPYTNDKDHFNTGTTSTYNQNGHDYAADPLALSVKQNMLSSSLEPPNPSPAIDEYQLFHQSSGNTIPGSPPSPPLEHGQSYPHQRGFIYDSRDNRIPSKIDSDQGQSSFQLSTDIPSSHMGEQYPEYSFDVSKVNGATFNPVYSNNDQVSIVPSVSFDITDFAQDRTDNSSLYLPRNSTSSTSRKTFRSNEESISNVEIKDISCSISNPGRYFRARIRPLDKEYDEPVLENGKSCSLIHEETSWYRLNISAFDLKNCGVRECRNSEENAQGLLCITIRIPRIRRLRTPEDIVFTIECQPRKDIAAQTKSFKLKIPRNDQPRLFISGGNDANFASKMALYIRPPRSPYFSQLLTSNDTVHLGDEIQLRCDIKHGEGWHYSRIMDVILYLNSGGIHTGDSAVLVGPNGCRNPHMKAVCPWNPVQHSDRPLTSSFTWKAFGFQDNENGNEEMTVTARVLACAHPSHCLLDTSSCADETPTKRQRRHYTGDVSTNNETTVWKSELTFKVKLSTDGSS